MDCVRTGDCQDKSCWCVGEVLIVFLFGYGKVKVVLLAK